MDRKRFVRSIYSKDATFEDPVLEQSRKKCTCIHKHKPKLKPVKNSNGIAFQPSLNTRINLLGGHDDEFQPSCNVSHVAPKYKAPKSKKQKKLEIERRRKYQEELNFCKYNVLTVPDPANTTKLDIKLEAPSAEIKEAKIAPRRPSTTPSEIYPKPPTRKDLSKTTPKTGTIINQTIKKKQKHIKKTIAKEKPKPVEPSKPPTIEELMAQELSTIEEMGEGEEMLATQDNYLTKQFRRKVAQLSKSTSVKSKDLKLALKETCEAEEAVSEEEHFISRLVQKFRRDSEIKRFEKPKRKVKKGTLESFSFTRLKQHTLKTFYYGVKPGTIHQGDKHFPLSSRNRQGICMPIAAYCFSVLKHPDKWTQADIDEIVYAGNDLFLECAGTQHLHSSNVELKLSDLRKYCKLGKKKVRFVVSEPEVTGMVRSEDRKVYNLTKAIKIFFGRYKAGILQTDTLNITIWKDKNFYFFDASPRTIDLYTNAAHGTALMGNFYDTTSVISVLLNRSDLENSPFVIYSIKAYKVLKRDAEEVDSTGVIPEIDNFQILDGEKAIALGSFDLADKCFGFSRNKQAVSIAVIALVYSKITPPSSWHRGTIDKIIIIGNQLFLECIENDEICEVTIDNLPAVFTIGPYLVEVYIVPNRFIDFMMKKGNCMLLERLEKFFEKNSNAIIQIENSTLAVWQQRNIYHCFDPYSRNQEGLKCRDGSACVSMHMTLNSLVSTISANFNDRDIFRIHALKVCKIHRDANKNKCFPKNLTMNDYPIESFQKTKMKKGNWKATTKSVTIDYDTNASMFQDINESLLEVDSTVRSIDIQDLPSLRYKYLSKSLTKILPKMKPYEEDFVANLDSPSLSDTQIEPSPLEQTGEDTEIEFVDLDAFDLTQEELELQQRGEGEDHTLEENEADISGQLEESMTMAEEGEDWYMVTSDFTQVGSHSLMSRRSEEVNTDFLTVEIPQEEVPTASRDIKAIKLQKDFGIDYEYELTHEPDITLDDELSKETNFVDLPDGSQIILGTQNMTSFGPEVEIMAPFVCIMAAAVAKKYSINSWSKEVIDYVLKCGSELHQNSNTRYDQNYKLEIPKITLGSTDFSVSVDYIFDTFLKPKVLSTAIKGMLFPRCPAGIVVTPTYSCAVFYKNHLYYLYDGFGNNEVGLGKGSSNTGVACLSRFQNINALVARILHNKTKREQEENVEYNRFVLSSCHVKQLPKEEEWEEISSELDEGEEQGESVVVQSFRKKKEPEEKKSSKMGYHLIDGLYKILGNKVIGSQKEIDDALKSDYFVCLCACLFLLNNPLKKWDDQKIDAVIDQGLKVDSNVPDHRICSKKIIKNILVDDYVFDVVVSKVKLTMYQAKRTLRSAIEIMLSKKYEYFILQFPNRSYVISVDKTDKSYHLFDPNDESGRASWTKYTRFAKLLRRIKKGVVRGGESYNFHSFEIMSIKKAPKHVVIHNRVNKYKITKKRKVELICKSFNEEVSWLRLDPIPWSWMVNKHDVPLWNHWFVDYQDDLYSLFGTISPLDERFPEENRGKQILGNLVVVAGMTQIYDLAEWTTAIMDSILIFGDTYFRECIKDINSEDYELALKDMKKECVIFPYSFRVKFTPVVEGTIFLVRLKQFNLYKGLRLFFDKYERRFGIICVTKGDSDKRLYAFGKTQESEYFLYDCETMGPPMFVDKDSSVPYVLRTTTLNRLLHVMTLTLRGGDFYIFELGLSELKSIT